MQSIPGRAAYVSGKGGARIGTLLDDRTVATFDPGSVGRENPAIIGIAAKSLGGGARHRYVHRNRRTVMTRISLQFQEPAGEVERHIDRANGAPTFQAAVRGDD